MPAKKKGKGSKLARMSDEERARYMQHRAELELEAKRRKQQLIAIFTKNKLKREEAFSRLNTAKIHEQWRFILRQIKCSELYQNAEYSWKNFDRVITAKDTLIKRLYNELEVAEEDHGRLQESHMEMIDKIFGIHKHKLTSLRNKFLFELHNFQQGEMTDLKELRVNMERHCKFVENIIASQKVLLENKFSDTRTRNAMSIFSVTYLKDDSMSYLMQQTHMRMEGSWADLMNIISEYEKGTINKRKQYEYLKEQDDSHQVKTAQYIKLQSQLQNVIDVLKLEQDALEKKRSTQITEMEKQVKTMNQKMWNLRKEFTVTKLKDSVQLKKLSVISHKIIEHLKHISEKGSMLQLLIKMISALAPPLSTIKRYSFPDPEAHTETVKYMLEPFDKLEKFWKRYNYAEVDNMLMKKDYKELLLENKKLRHILRTYLITASRISTTKSHISVIT